MHAIVFFSRFRRRPISLKRTVRLWARRPRRAADWAIAGFARAVAGTDLLHTAIAFNGVVLDPTICGNTLYPVVGYVERHPSLACCFTVPITRDPHLLAFELGQRKPAIPTFVRWLTGGRTKATSDCVSVVSAALRTAGLSVPSRIITPSHLLQWLEGQGFERTELE